MVKVHQLPLDTKENATPADVLSWCARNAADFDQVLVVGRAHDGGLIFYPAGSSVAEANLLLDEAKDHVRNPPE